MVRLSVCSVTGAAHVCCLMVRLSVRSVTGAAGRGMHTSAGPANIHPAIRPLPQAREEKKKLSLKDYYKKKTRKESGDKEGSSDVGGETSRVKVVGDEAKEGGSVVLTAERRHSADAEKPRRTSTEERSLFSVFKPDSSQQGSSADKDKEKGGNSKQQSSVLSESSAMKSRDPRRDPRLQTSTAGSSVDPSKTASTEKGPKSASGNREPGSGILKNVSSIGSLITQKPFFNYQPLAVKSSSNLSVDSDDAGNRLVINTSINNEGSELVSNSDTDTASEISSRSVPNTPEVVKRPVPATPKVNMNTNTPKSSSPPLTTTDKVSGATAALPDANKTTPDKSSKVVSPGHAQVSPTTDDQVCSIFPYILLFLF